MSMGALHLIHIWKLDPDPSGSDSMQVGIRQALYFVYLCV